MSNKYKPSVGDIILDNNIPMVVMEIKIDENYASCSYDRYYTLCEETYLARCNGLYSEEDIKNHGRIVHITGIEFPDIEQVKDIAPYEITPTRCFNIRQKKAKTITVYE